MDCLTFLFKMTECLLLVAASLFLLACIYAIISGTIETIIKSRAKKKAMKEIIEEAEKIIKKYSEENKKDGE